MATRAALAEILESISVLQREKQRAPVHDKKPVEGSGFEAVCLRTTHHSGNLPPRKIIDRLFRDPLQVIEIDRGNPGKAFCLVQGLYYQQRERDVNNLRVSRRGSVVRVWVRNGVV